MFDGIILYLYNVYVTRTDKLKIFFKKVLTNGKTSGIIKISSQRLLRDT